MRFSEIHTKPLENNCKKDKASFVFDRASTDARPPIISSSHGFPNKRESE